MADHGELPLPATGLPFVRALATTTLYRILPNPGLPSKTGALAGAVVAAAAAGPLRRPSRPGLPTPNADPNRPLAILAPFPRPSSAKPATSSLGIAQAAPASRPKGDIATEKIFPRASLKKGNSNSKTIWLFLVNCVENHREIRKMQNQFFWIRGEISHNFCYSG
jgi:hypothetical protein